MFVSVGSASNISVAMRRIGPTCQILRVRFANGWPTGEYEDFLAGFVASDQDMTGAKDAAALVSVRLGDLFLPARLDTRKRLLDMRAEHILSRPLVR